MRTTLIVLLFLLASVPSGCARRSRDLDDPLAGAWQLNRDRTHYGAAAHPRAQERFSCEHHDDSVRCSIVGEWEDGTRVDGFFEARYGGPPGPVSGVPEVDAVSIRRAEPGSADATFYSHGRPIFGYRSFKSPDGRSLIVVAVDPRTRRVLNSLVVYDAR